ncbi:MAG: signal peptidase II [Rhodospirillales bacterium]|nr:signal peptidase II [Rhodospirillales bacterium]
MKNRAALAGWIAALVVFLADQASKYWVLHGIDLPVRRQIVLLPVLNLTFVQNRGVTFGLLGGAGVGAWLLAGVALAVVAGLLVWMHRTRSRLAAIALGAVAGGAGGNILDRFRHGYVVDFIQAHAGAWSWYVFNVGDAAIVCGVIALVIESQFAARR